MLNWHINPNSGGILNIALEIGFIFDILFIFFIYKTFLGSSESCSGRNCFRNPILSSYWKSSASKVRRISILWKLVSSQCTSHGHQWSSWASKLASWPICSKLEDNQQKIHRLKVWIIIIIVIIIINVIIINGMLLED